MNKVAIYILVCLIGFFTAKWIYKSENKIDTNEDIQIVLHSIKNMSKLVVSEGSFSEVYTYKDAKKYFYDTFEFNKSIIVIVNAKVQVMFDLEKMLVDVDTLEKKIKIKYIPKEEIIISPNVKYFDMQQSTFNTFTKEELNKINKKSILKIKETAEVSVLKKNAKKRLIVELSKIYQLSTILGWEVIDETDEQLLNDFFIEKPKF
ncbi:MAG: DUF4230 domain-containing protein [Flavobacteriaceae bacterium]|nr:DUF4230 domain-containing protein [Flavobacteriaceae bacterium]